MKSIDQTGAGQLAWVAEFEQAFAEARFGAAGQLYDERANGSEPSTVALKAARAHLRSDPSVALQVLLGLYGRLRKPAERIERDSLLGEAYARTRDFESSDEHLRAAEKAARAAGDDDLLAMVGYRLVRRYLIAEDARRARAALDLARSGRSRAARVSALYAETLILPYEERVREQAIRLVELLRLLDPQEADFTDMRAWGTHTLAVLARDLFVPDAAAEIQRQLSGSPWPVDFAPNLFQTLKALGWTQAQQGDYFNAFRYLKRASEVAETGGWMVVAACDRSYLARCFGEHRWSRVELDEAEYLAAAVDWGATFGEERIGLLLLAELFAAIDPARAASYLAAFRELGEMKSPLHHRHDPRFDAFARYSTGVVEIALGRPKRGIGELRAALRIFERYGYQFRAARCLASEYAATSRPEMVASLREKLQDYPHSWLAAELQRSATLAKTNLPPMRRRVFGELCKGKSSAQIAASLGRSEYTVNNHVQELFKTFGVKSRSALLIEAMRRGLVRVQ